MRSTVAVFCVGITSLPFPPDAVRERRPELNRNFPFDLPATTNVHLTASAYNASFNFSVPGCFPWPGRSQSYALQASLPDLRQYVRRSNRLSFLTAGLRAHESQEGLVVIRTDRCELYPESLSTFRPPHGSLHT